MRDLLRVAFREGEVVRAGPPLQGNVWSRADVVAQNPCGDALERNLRGLWDVVGSHYPHDSCVPPKLLSPAVHHRLCAARTLLANDELPALSIPALAARVGLSPFHLTRRFAAVFGATPHQYRLATRLERARLLLARGELSVTEVCWELGFSSLGSFSALFSARVGESPRAYQRRMRRVWSSPGLTSLITPSCLGLMARIPPSAWRSFREAHGARGT